MPHVSFYIPRSLRLDYFQKLALLWAGGFAVLAVILAYPLRQVFNGQWLLKQQVSWELFTPDPSSNAIFDGTLTIRFYAVSILVGVLLGYWLALSIARRHYVASTVIDRLLIGMVIFGLIGARLFFAAFNWELYYNNPSQIFLINEGGLAFFGMLSCALLYLVLYCRRFKFSFYEFADILCTPLLVGQIFGRFGNFFNYESYGGPTSVFWKMYIPDSVNFYDSLNQKFFHPTFLYEIIPNVLLLVYILWHYSDLTRKRSGLAFATYAIGYGAIRFFTEFFRIDALKIILPQSWQFEYANLSFDTLYASQIAALILIAIGLYIYSVRSKVIYLKKTMVELRTRKKRKVMFN